MGAQERSKDYRRGTVLGLTMAEMFIIIAFLILLLLVLAKAIDRDECADAAEHIGALTEKQKQEVVKLAAKGLLTPLVQEAELQAIVAAAAKLPRPQVKELAKLVRGHDYGEIAGLVNQLASMIEEGFPAERLQGALELARRLAADGELSESELRALSAAMERIAAQSEIDLNALLKIANQAAENGKSPEEIAAAMSLASELSPEQMQQLSELRSRLVGKLLEADKAAKEFAKELQDSTGDLIESLGGEIDSATGTVTLPNTVLFDQGSSALKESTVQFLEKFCIPWIETARKIGRIGELHVEGHASSEWREPGLSEDEVFLKNMRLSQGRALAITDRCIRNIGGGDAARWAQKHLVSNGYSSSRVLRDDAGVELFSASRRVIFRAKADRILLDEIEEELKSN